jgi:hypothetical protein
MIAHENGKQTIYTLWIGHDDEFLGDHLRERGFKLGRGYVYLTRSLDGLDFPLQEPAGFSLRSCEGLPEVEARTKAQYGSFGSSAPFERYLERFISFMRSPAYDPRLDIVAVSPMGEISAFCIVWIDPLNRGILNPSAPADFHARVGEAIMVEATPPEETGMAELLHLKTIRQRSSYMSRSFPIVNRLGLKRMCEMDVRKYNRKNGIGRWSRAILGLSLPARR